jgi:periplasmic copper chaperone A
MKRTIILLMLTVFLFSACTTPTKGGSGSVKSINVSGVWGRESAAMGEMKNAESETDFGTGAIYMQIENNGNKPEKLLKVESNIASAVEMHQTTMDGDVMKMGPVDSIEIPANGKVELKPGGYHIMLVGLKQELKAGEKIHLKLNFETSGSLELDAEIRNP